MSARDRISERRRAAEAAEEASRPTQPPGPEHHPAEKGAELVREADGLMSAVQYMQDGMVPGEILPLNVEHSARYKQWQGAVSDCIVRNSVELEAALKLAQECSASPGVTHGRIEMLALCVTWFARELGIALSQCPPHGEWYDVTAELEKKAEDA